MKKAVSTELTKAYILKILDLLAYFKFRRTVLLWVLTSLPEEKWSSAIREAGKQRKESVYWRARSLATHEREHLLETERKLDESGISLSTQDHATSEKVGDGKWQK